MELTYKNEFGEVGLHGRGGIFSVYEADGFELQGRERSLINFYNSDGYREASSRFGQRIMTISGEVLATARDELKRAVRVLSHPGLLTVKIKDELREIAIADVTFNINKRNGAYKRYVMQFVADISHFTDCEDNIAGVFSRKNLITKDTYLPAVFTERYSTGKVENDGDFPTEPVIVINCFRGADQDGNITIENSTNGGKIVIEHMLKEDERVTVDIPNRQIISSIDGDITHQLARGSYLSDMELECGTNEFTVLASDGNRNAEVYLRYRNLYSGVII